MELQLQHQSFHEYSELISFMIDWFDLLALQGALKFLLQHHNKKTSILQCSAFFTVQLSHPHMTTGKTIAVTIQTFVGKVMSLIFNTLSRFVIAFLPRSKHLLISWLQSPCTVIWEPKKIKSVTVFIVSPYVCDETMANYSMSQQSQYWACESCSVVSDSLQPYELYIPWNSPGQNTGVSSHSLLEGIFPTQGSNLGLLHCRQILCHLSYPRSQHFRMLA